MSHNKNKNNGSGAKDAVSASNDQLGENAGEGRLMREQTKKDKKKS